MRFSARLLDRRLLVMVVVGVLALLAGVLTAVQMRAGQAEADRRELAAQVAQQELAREEARAEAERAAERAAAEAELATDWAAAATDAQGRLVEADAVLVGSNGRVADDAVRLGLREAIETVRALADDGAGERELTVGVMDALNQAVATMVAAATTVTEAQAAWQAEQDALAAAAQAEAEAEAAAKPSRPALGGPPSQGAGPDCGGPGSYEPPKNTGYTFYTSTPSESGDGTNGNIPATQLAPLSWCTDSQGNKQWLQPAAAAALTELNAAFKDEFGESIAVDMSYRSYETQVEMRQAFGSIAAKAGTSNHGTGLAFDTWEWKAYSFGSARYEWLVANGPTYGWVAPDWARQNGSNPEYWHFEYTG